MLYVEEFRNQFFEIWNISKTESNVKNCMRFEEYSKHWIWAMFECGSEQVRHGSPDKWHDNLLKNREAYKLPQIWMELILLN